MRGTGGACGQPRGAPARPGYGGRVPLRPDPGRAASARARLEALRDAVAEVEDDVLGCLVVTGEPEAQRVLDGWLDQVADTVRAVGESAAEVVRDLDRLAPDDGSAGGWTAGSASGAADAPASALPREESR